MKLKLSTATAGSNRPLPKGSKPPKGFIRGLGHLVALINSKGLLPDLRQAVIDEVSKYPDGALDFAWSNLNDIIMRVAQRATPETKPLPPAKKEELVLEKRASLEFE